MSERDRNPLDGADAPRSMPDALRTRIEAELLAAAPMPTQARERISKKLADPTAALFEGIDGSRPLPDRTRRRIEGALVRPPAHRMPRRLSSRPWLAAAAAATLLLASISALTNSSNRVRNIPAALEGGGLLSPEVSTSGDAAGVGNPGFAPEPDLGAAGASTDGAPPLDAAPTVNMRSLHGTGAVGGKSSSPYYNGPPPFALGDYGVDSYAYELGPPGGGEPATTTTPPPKPPFRVSIAKGDASAVAGFNAYVELLNQYDGAGGRRFEIVADGKPADAAVNLSGAPRTTAPSVITIESPFAADRSLRNNVFGFAGPVDRQAHLIAYAVYPTSTSATAVIYREPTGVLHDDVPAAIQSVLEERGVRSVVIDVRPGQQVVPVPTADSVFLSLNPAAAKRVVEAYAEPPPRGFNGIGTLAEADAVTDLPPGTRFISPYAFPTSEEAKRVQQRTKLPAGLRLYHGWVAAKTLAVAVWRHDPRSPAQVRTALEQMNGYANGFAPAYSFRPGTHAVRPEGVLFLVGQNGASQTGDFLTDPRP